MTSLILPAVFDYQRKAIFGPERYSIVEGSTKVGKTFPCLLWLLNQCGEHGAPNRSFWWVAPVYEQAEIAYRRMKVEILGRADPEQTVWKPNDSKLTITLKGCGAMRFKSAEKPDNLYGDDVYALVVDEATRCREESWFALRSTISATGAKVRIIGNVKGRKNWVYRLARAGLENATHHKLTADDAINSGILSQKEVDDAAKMMPRAVFRELFFAEPTEDGSNPFGISAIRACVGPASLSTQPATVFGVDLAKSVDWTVVYGLDDAGNLVFRQRWQSDWGQTKTRLLSIIGSAPACIDSTGVGDPIVEAMQRESPNIEGFKFTGSSKQQLMEGLASAIHQRQVMFDEYADDPLVTELEAFEYEYTRTGVRYSAPEGSHDDCVCALALAVQCRREHPVGFGAYVGGATRFVENDRIEIGWEPMQNGAEW